MTYFVKRIPFLSFFLLLPILMMTSLKTSQGKNLTEVELPSNSTGQIAFQSQRDGQWEIYVMDETGLEQTRLTTAGGEHPSWQVGGGKVAFTSQRDGDSEIYVMNSDGSDQLRLTHSFGYDGEPDWSPDGNTLVFHSDRDGQGEIYRMNSDGTNSINLTKTTANEWGPSWSPNGEQIAYVSDETGSQKIHLLDINNNEVVCLTCFMSIDTVTPEWSPDGQQIVFEGFDPNNSNIYVINVDGTGLTQMVDFSTKDTQPFWAPDGNSIIFSSDITEQIYHINIDGSGLAQLTTPPGRNYNPHWRWFTSENCPEKGIPGDQCADIVIGQPNFDEMVPNEVTDGRLFNPGGVIIDRSVTPNRLYVYDGANSRILGLHVNDQSGRRAELVIGQPSGNGHSACNGDGNFRSYPNRVPAGADTLCSIPEGQVSPREGGSFANMAVDAQGNLYVPDFDNHRVLFYESPFTTDTIADDVWGQVDFAGNDCNEGRGVFEPDANSLCYRSPFNEGFVGGVGLDSNNNLWITDNQNNRVLRFPFDPQSGRPAHTADLVLGQADFFSGRSGSALNQMHAPAAVRIASSGRVYVADSLNDRVLFFDPPYVSGMMASGTLGTGLRLPAAIEFDLQGNIWVSDAGNHQLLRFNTDGMVDRVLFKDVPNYTGQCGGAYTASGDPFYFPDTGIYQDSANVCDSRGSIGIDSDGNIYVTGTTFVQDVWRFPAPFPDPTPGVAHSADVQVFKPYSIGQTNAVTARSLGDPRGVVVHDGQLIVADGGRILFWNNAPWSLTNGKAADGFVGAPNFNTETVPAMGQIRVDGHNHLWTMRSDTISVYQLPLITQAMPIYTLRPPLPVLGGGTIDWGSYLDIASIAITADQQYLWLADPNNNRVIRIHQPLQNPMVDIVLGQLSLDETGCNQGRGEGQPSQDSLCNPGNVTFDRQGNLFVSDHALEVRGNHRLLQYDASLFPTAPSTAVFGIPATRVYGTNGSFTGSPCQDALCGPWEPAFNSRGAMVVGLNRYLSSQFPLVYKDPLTNPLPTANLKDYYSLAYATHYDAEDNLYVTDRNRGRVLIYLAHTLPEVQQIYLPLIP